MNAQNPQLPLSLAPRDGERFDSFFVGDNQLLVDVLHSAATSGAERQIAVWGAGGSGKSHLLNATCHLAGEHNRTAAFLPMRDMIAYVPDLLHGLERVDLVAIDDVDQILNRADWQRALFDFINRARETGTSVICAAQINPGSLDILPDLSSRLLWGPVLRIQKPSDHQLAKAVSARAKSMGLTLSEEVLDYLLSRYSRELGALYNGLAELDRISLVEQRRLTLPFVREALKIR